jgi:hypothetical protein
MFELGRVWLEATVPIHDIVQYFYWILTEENDKMLSRGSLFLTGIQTCAFWMRIVYVTVKTGLR